MSLGALLDAYPDSRRHTRLRTTQQPSLVTAVISPYAEELGPGLVS
jgi:hypothetical protein